MVVFIVLLMFLSDTLLLSWSFYLLVFELFWNELNLDANIHRIIVNNPILEFSSRFVLLDYDTSFIT